MNHLQPATALVVTAFFFLSCNKQIYSNDEFNETEPPVLQANYIQVNAVSHGFYSALPARYNRQSVKYPLLLWIHGNGQVGDGRSDLGRILYGGVPKLLKEGKFPPQFRVNGKTYSFIVLAPQFTSWPTNEQVGSFVEYAKKNYRIDASQIYLSGLSMGGVVTADAGAFYASQLAAIVPIAGVSFQDVSRKCAAIAGSRLPVWVFQNKEDVVFDVNDTRKWMAALLACKGPVAPRYTEMLPFGDNGHDAWTTATDPNYREGGLNIYEWMLQYHR